MREKIELIKKVVVWTLGNAFVYHVMLPLLWVIIHSEEERAVKEARDDNP